MSDEATTTAPPKDPTIDPNGLRTVSADDHVGNDGEPTDPPPPPPNSGH